MPGEIAYAPIDQSAGSSGGSGGGGGYDLGGAGAWEVRRKYWDLLNQSWNCRLATVTQPALATILQSNPDLPGFSSGQYKLPNLGGLSSDDLQQISPH